MAPCPICLDEDLTEVGELDCCVHRFCFSCILSWSGRQNRCPCCRARFGVIRRNPLDLEALPQCTGKGTVDHYPGQILEEVPVPDRDPADDDFDDDSTDDDVSSSEEPPEEVTCEHCNEVLAEEETLLCTGCDRGWHPSCLGLEAVPEGEWKCADCSPHRTQSLAAVLRRLVAEPAARSPPRHSSPATPQPSPATPKPCNPPGGRDSVEARTTVGKHSGVVDPPRGCEEGLDDPHPCQKSEKTPVAKQHPIRFKPPSDENDERDDKPGCKQEALCHRCKRGDCGVETVVCSGCHKRWHIYCANLKEVPEGPWECPECKAPDPRPPSWPRL